MKSCVCGVENDKNVKEVMGYEYFCTQYLWVCWEHLAGWTLSGGASPSTSGRASNRIPGEVGGPSSVPPLLRRPIGAVAVRWSVPAAVVDILYPNLLVDTLTRPWISGGKWMDGFYLQFSRLYFVYFSVQCTVYNFILLGPIKQIRRCLIFIKETFHPPAPCWSGSSFPKSFGLWK